MATKGKKGGKKKGQTLNLNEFLGGEGGGSYRPPGAGATTTVEVGRGAGSTWAEEMDDEGFDDRPKQQIVLPTAPRAALGPDIDDDRIPKRPPYTAYIANLPYDVDEDQITEVFERAKLKIEQVRLMKDEGGRLRGYGYADFQDRDSLVDVLTMTDLAVNNRKMRIDLASQAGKERGGGGFGDREDRGGRREEDPNAGRSDASDDWRRGPPPPARDDTRDRDRDKGGYNGRDSFDRDKGGSRGFSSYEPPRERDGGSRYGGFSRDRDGGGGGGGGFSRDRDSYSRDSGREREAPKERPKLSLAPRSKAKEDEEGGAAQSSIFGGAKPVDTVKKEKEMEEKLLREKEEKEKAQEEARKNKPSAASIFGGAKPVDTAQREKEIESKLAKMSVSKDSDRKEEREREKPAVEGAWRRKDGDGGEPARGGAYRPPGRREDGDRRDDRGYDREKRDDRGGYDRDRRDDRGGYDRDRRDDRGSSSGYDRDRRDDRGSSGYDRDRRDDRGSSSYDRDRRDDRGSSSGYERDRRDDKGYDSGGKKDDQDQNDERNRDARGVSSEKDDKKARTPEPKKYEEPKPQNVVAPNKFAFLQEEEAGNGSSEEN